MNAEDIIENKRKRLIFRSFHRGMKEMDLIMGSFAEKNVPGFSEEELVLYDDILELNDPDLYDWISRKTEPPANVINDVFDRVMAHKLVVG